jgi:DNA-binding HxlR family transcriptional regulator
MSTRTYGEACPTAHALDLVGERWALLIVRELLLGPRRFNDLLGGMPHASPRILAQRLRELELVSVVRRRKLGPPVSAWVYDLTNWGTQLEGVLIHLGRWGDQSSLLDVEADVTVGSVMLAFRSRFDPRLDHDLRTTYALHFGDDHITARFSATGVQVARQDAEDADVVIDTDPKTFAALLARRLSPHEAEINGRLKLTGDEEAAKRLFAAKCGG